GRGTSSGGQQAGELGVRPDDRLDRIMAALWPKVIKADVSACETALKTINRRAALLGLDLINRNGVADTDMASLLGSMLAQLQSRYIPADPDVDTIVEADIVSEIESGDDA
ncbi:hypothetical protein ACWCSH_30375, partial [Streptosporangium sp. NPDC001682]